LQVRDGDGIRLDDKDDFPAAPLATLLSLCPMLTHNYKHFGALSVRNHSQDADGVMAVLGRQHRPDPAAGRHHDPRTPAPSRHGLGHGEDRPVGLVILGVVVAAGGIYWYNKQPTERRGQIKTTAGQSPPTRCRKHGKAADGVHQARLQLRVCIVPKPEHRTPTSEILRELALSPESLPAARLADLLHPSGRHSLAEIRAFPRANDSGLFIQVRRGGFMLGSRYQLGD
jgi:hypothetical protein